MKTSRLIVLLAVLVLGFTTFSFAEGYGIRQRVIQAYERIERGIRSGALTREEAHQLKHDLNRVRDDEARMKADGILFPPEIARLEKELNRLEKRISRLKYNDNTRGHEDRRDHDERRDHGR